MSEFIDLSHTIEENMAVYPGTPPPEFKEIAKIEMDGFTESLLSLSTHTGTHIDVESHVIQNGKTINTYSLDHFYGKALVINCLGKQQIETDLLHEVLKDIEPPEFILLYTGWDKYWGNDHYYKQYPVLSTSAAVYLSKLGIKGVGVDSSSFDTFDNDQLSNHKILLKKGLILIENLKGLNRIVGREIIFSCFPLKLKVSDSSPIRACAIIN